MTKVCSRCKQEKPIEDFSRSCCTRDGFNYYCKRCRCEATRKHATAHPDETRASVRAYYADHREALTLKQRNRRLAMPPEQLARVIERSREWKRTHPEKVVAQRRRYYLEHNDPKKREMYWAKRRREQPLRITAHQMVACIRFRTRATEVPVDPAFVNNECIEALLRRSPACAMCGVELDYGPKGQGRGKYNRANSPSLDRFVPGLGYREDNVAVLCHQCNTRKNDHTLASALLLVEYLSRNAISVGRRAA